MIRPAFLKLSLILEEGKNKKALNYLINADKFYLQYDNPSLKDTYKIISNHGAKVTKFLCKLPYEELDKMINDVRSEKERTEKRSVSIVSVHIPDHYGGIINHVFNLNNVSYFCEKKDGNFNSFLERIFEREFKLVETLDQIWEKIYPPKGKK